MEEPLQSEDVIREQWKLALVGQPWHIQTMGNLATPIVAGVVAQLQLKMQEQAFHMKWINENAMPIILANETVVELLGGSPLIFNNTRAKYEKEKDVWSASMDVLSEPSSSSSSSSSTASMDSSPKTGLVNAYFTPREEEGIRILVVEIDDCMHNLTWKGLSYYT